MHILSPQTDNCPAWISGRERMTVENTSWSISSKECCRPRRGLNPRPPGLQSDGFSCVFLNRYKKRIGRVQNWFGATSKNNFVSLTAVLSIVPRPSVFNEFPHCDAMLHSNLNSSNTDGSFTMVNSNSFLSPTKFFRQLKKTNTLGIFSYHFIKLYVVCTY